MHNITLMTSRYWSFNWPFVHTEITLYPSIIRLNFNCIITSCFMASLYETSTNIFKVYCKKPCYFLINGLTKNKHYLLQWSKFHRNQGLVFISHMCKVKILDLFILLVIELRTSFLKLVITTTVWSRTMKYVIFPTPVYLFKYKTQFHIYGNNWRE